MNTIDFYNMEFPGIERPSHKRIHSKGKSLTSNFRDASDYLFTFHAVVRMEERKINTTDVSILLENGRWVPLRERKGIFLHPGEIPKGKKFSKTYGRLQDAVIVVEQECPLVITVINDWTKGEKQIFRTADLNKHLWSRKNGGANHFELPCGPYRFKRPSDLLYTYASVQQKELWKASSAEISQIVRYGQCFTTARYLYLYQTRVLSFEKQLPACLQGMAIIVDRNRPIVEAVSRVTIPQGISDDLLTKH